MTDKNNRPERIFIDPPINPPLITRGDLKYALIGGIIFPATFFLVAQILVWQGFAEETMTAFDWALASIINGVVGAIFCIVIVPMIMHHMGWKK